MYSVKHPFSQIENGQDTQYILSTYAPFSQYYGGVKIEESKANESEKRNSQGLGTGRWTVSKESTTKADAERHRYRG